MNKYLFKTDRTRMTDPRNDATRGYLGDDGFLGVAYRSMDDTKVVALLEKKPVPGMSDHTQKQHSWIPAQLVGSSSG